MNSGVKSYVHASAVVENFFPVDNTGIAHIACAYCRFYSKSANRCRLTEEIIYRSENYTGNGCPLNPIEEENK